MPRAGGRAGAVAAGNLTLTGAVFAVDGSRMLRGSAEGPAVDALAIGRGLASGLLERGAAALIQSESA
jgi:porphobilinogen deaminase